MSRTLPLTISLFISSIMTSTDYRSPSIYTVYGRAVDEEDHNLNGADVTIESATDRRHIVSAADGSFSTDICIYGFCDEIRVRVQFGTMQGFERIIAHGSHISVDVIVKDDR